MNSVSYMKRKAARLKLCDYIGTGLSILAYLFIINGSIVGFGIGIIASSFLLYVAIKSGLDGLKWLQLFFICANIYALTN